MRVPTFGWRSIGLVVAAVAVAAVVAACGGGGAKKTTGTVPHLPPQAAPATSVAKSWSLPNADLWNNRTIASPITSSNVSQLKEVWAIPITTTTHGAASFGSFSSTPVFSGGVVYLQDLGDNVYAVDESTGKVKWTYRVPANDSYGEGPNGVTVVNGVVYGETATAAFALDAATGEQVWKAPGLADSPKQGQGFNIAPMVVNGVEYLATSGQITGGVAYALNAKTGKVIWKFEETKDPSERSAGGVGGTGGSWGTPLVIGGSVYFGVANPYRSIDDALSKSTPLPYNDSTVSLNAKSGKLQWHYQAVPNDFHDWDMQIGPMYAPSGPTGGPTVIDAGKMGYVYAYDAKTGKLFWKTSVGKHNGHDNDSTLALEGKWKKPKLPYTYCPGSLGGVETQMAESNGVIYVPINNLCSSFTSYSSAFGQFGSLTKATGQMEALSLKTGKVLWNTHFPSSDYGSATVTNDLVFTTTFNPGRLIALSRSTGKVVWSAPLSADTNSAISIDGNKLVTAAGYPSGAGEKAEIVAYQLNGKPQPSATNGTTSPTPKTSTSSLTSSSSAATTGAGAVLAGGKVFQTTCGSCHTLSEAGTTGTVGPNLDKLKPSDALVQHQVTNGGGGMPAFGSQLSKQQIKNVARFVSSVAGTGKKVPGLRKTAPTSAP